MRRLIGPPLSTSTICRIEGRYEYIQILELCSNESHLTIPRPHQDLPLAQHQSPDWWEVGVEDSTPFNGRGVQLVGLEGVGEALIPQTHHTILATRDKSLRGRKGWPVNLSIAATLRTGRKGWSVNLSTAATLRTGRKGTSL